VGRYPQRSATDAIVASWSPQRPVARSVKVDEMMSNNSSTGIPNARATPLVPNRRTEADACSVSVP